MASSIASLLRTNGRVGPLISRRRRGTSVRQLTCRSKFFLSRKRRLCGGILPSQSELPLAQLGHTLPSDGRSANTRSRGEPNSVGKVTRFRSGPEAVIALSQISVGWDAGRSPISERRSVIVFVIQSDAAAACLAEIALHRHPRSHFDFDHHLARLRGQTELQ